MAYFQGFLCISGALHLVNMSKQKERLSVLIKIQTESGESGLDKYSAEDIDKEIKNYRKEKSDRNDPILENHLY